MKYAAFLRGINVGGRQAPAARLKDIFQSAGFTDVRTVLASGNVVFETPETSREKVIETVEGALRRELGFEVTVQVRTFEELRAIIDAAPFRGIQLTPDVRLYVSFHSEEPRGKLDIPSTSENGDIRLLNRTGGEVYGVVRLSKQTGTTDYMNLVDKEYGRTVTTRNWNTLLKLAGN